MWWTIPLVMLLLFVFVGIPLILEYHAEAKRSSINEQNNTEIIFIKKGEKVMQNGAVIEARTHAEFLNEAFGTNYKEWMKCVWKYDEEWTVWMVRFNKTNGGWRNTFIGNDRIKEENIGKNSTWDGKSLTHIHKKKIAIEIMDLGYTRKYIFRGKFVYDEKNSDPYTIRYYDKVSDEI